MELRVFLSWQIATKAQGFDNKSLLVECVQEALKQIENKGDLKDVFFDFKEGMRKEPGNPDVANTMMELVDSCNIFIGDMTVTQDTGGFIGDFLRWIGVQHFRKEPNSNVYGEYNRALGKYKEFCKQTVLVLNTVNGEPEKDINVIPFDTRGKRFPITFTLKNDKKKSVERAKKQLRSVLPNAIQLAAIAAKAYIDKWYSPFVTWQNHSTKNEFQGKFEWTNALAEIKRQLLKSKGVVRLLGLSGLGKTRLVLESFRNSNMQNQYLYCDCQQYATVVIKNTIIRILQDYSNAILILDNCDKDLLSDIINLRKSENVGTKVITILNQPEEKNSNCDGITYISMDNKYQEVVEKILKRFVALTEDQMNRIKDFSDGIPMMAELLVKGLQNGNDLGNLGDTQLINKMLGCSPETDERKVLQSLSLFDYIGYKKERRNEMEFVATTQSITSIDKSSDTLLINLFDNVIQKYTNRTVLERRGRQIGIRPTPLAMYLAAEWLESCTDERMLAVVQAIQGSEHCAVLISEFHNQFKNMGFNTKAREILNNLLGPNSPFGSAEVLNTEVGSHLFRTFVEVNPIAVSGLLTRVFAQKSLEALKDIREGRRNIVWTLEKLCFDNKTFLEGAYLMMRFGLAENEKWDNNATGEFSRLFPIYLPATSISLNDRLIFLQTHILETENKPLIMSALKRALYASDFMYMSGAELQGTNKLACYQPDDLDEIKHYIKGCLNLVIGEIRNNTEFSDNAKEILETSIISLCIFRAAEIALPYIEEAAEIYNNDWDKMQETLAFFEDRCMPIMAPETQLKYKTILNNLTKEDFISRFRRVEKDYRLNRELDFDKRLKQQREIYKSLAEELITSDGLNYNMLKQIINTDCLSSYPFGERLSQLMDNDLQKDFISDYVEIANSSKRPNYQILIDYVSAMSKESFDASSSELFKLKDTQYIFAIWGRRGFKLGDEYFSILVRLINEGRAKVSDFTKYGSYIVFGSQSENNILELLNLILPMQRGFATVIKISAMLMRNMKSQAYPRLNSFISNAIINYNDNPTSVLFVENATYIANYLLNTEDNKSLAIRMHDAILNYTKTADGYISLEYEKKELYRTLFIRYFDSIWLTLSQALLSDGEQFMIYYRLKNILGASIVDNTLPIFQEGNHDKVYLKWCEQYPDTAPARIMSIISPVDSNGNFIPLVMEILNKYADRPQVLNELEGNINSFSSIGSVAPYYEDRKKIFKSVLNHPMKEVRDWAKTQIEFCNYMIDREITREAEGNVI